MCFLHHKWRAGRGQERRDRYAEHVVVSTSGVRRLVAVPDGMSLSGIGIHVRGMA